MVSGNGSAAWPDETPTPTCNLLRLTTQHWEQNEADYRNLARRLRRSHATPKRFSVDAASARLYNEVARGQRQLVWYPQGLELFTELFPFFVKRSLGLMMPPRLGRLLVELRANPDNANERESWILSPKQPSIEPTAREPLIPRQAISGVFPLLPSVLQWAYLIALALSRQEDQGITSAENPFPVLSSGLGDLRFVRSSTWIMQDVFVGVAYLPGTALFFDSFAADHCPSNLFTADAIIL